MGELLLELSVEGVGGSKLLLKRKEVGLLVLEGLFMLSQLLDSG